MVESREEYVILFDCLNIKNGGGVTVALQVIVGFVNAGWSVHVLCVSEKLAKQIDKIAKPGNVTCLLYTSPSPRDS